MIEDGKTVSIEYTLKLTDGTEVATNAGEEPLVYTQGKGEILPALEKELAGLNESDTKTVTLTPQQAYGEVDPEAFREVELETIPETARTEGSLLATRDQAGNERTVRVHEVRDDAVIIDFNHPLAGQTLEFAVKVVGVQ